MATIATSPDTGRPRPVDGALLLRFAIIADTHIRLPGEASTTSWQANRLATERTLAALEQVTKASPAFVVHLGDVIHPVPHLPTYVPACKVAAELIGASGLPFHFVPGNHDVGDKISLVTPAHEIDDFSLEIYERLVAPSHKSFDAAGLHFVIFNTSLIGSGLAAEAAQFAWLEQDLAANRGRRIFLFMHYPLYMGEPNEPSLYDNVELPGRARLLALLADYCVEAGFAGHVHNFFYHDYEGTELYCLLSTSFVRPDYSELFDVEPVREFGRDDVAKLGWAEVEIYESGHVVQVRRTLEPVLDTNHPLTKVHPKYRHRTALGTHLRTAWAEPRPISYNGPIEEFRRRKVRNDYLLLGLAETGIRDLRVPASDMLDPAYRPRMESLVAAGHRFTVFTVGVSADPDIWAAAKALAADVEIILLWRDIGRQVVALEHARAGFDGRLSVACIVSPADHRNATFKAGYLMSFGFDVQETGLVAAFHEQTGAALDLGYVFRIAPSQSPLSVGQEISSFARRLGLRLTLNLVLGSDDAAACSDNDVLIANRVAETMLIGAASDHLMPFIDTFADHDRGYFPRHGLYDASYNPRLASRVVANLHAFFHQQTCLPVIHDVLDGNGARSCTVFLEDSRYQLALFNPITKGVNGEHTAQFVPNAGTDAMCLDLGTGEFCSFGQLAQGVRSRFRSPLLIFSENFAPS
jgi:3',5'-cyclic AMP phosphodiesterase CpdA